MDALLEEELMEDVLEDEGGFESDFLDDEFEGFGEFEAYGDELGEDLFIDEEDEFEAFDVEGEGYDEDGEDELADVMAEALGEDDADQFIGALVGAIPTIARGVGGIFRKIRDAIRRRRARRRARQRRTATPQRFSDPVEEALEAMTEVAVKKPEARPVVAALAARSLLKRKAARLSPASRKKVIKDLDRSIKKLTAAAGPRAVRAVPPIVKATKKQGAAKALPSGAKIALTKRKISQVARKPSLAKALSRPRPKGKAVLAGAVSGR